MFKWLPFSKKNNKIDFHALVQEAKRTRQEEDMEKVWAAFYGLPEIYVLLSPLQNEHAPFFASIHEQKWLFVFTSSEILQQTAPDLIGTKKPVHFVKLSTVAAFEWLDKWKHNGVYGIRVNQGDYGFYTPLDNLLPMKEYFDEQNRE